MLMQRKSQYTELPRSLSDWALDAAFELDEALKGRSGDPAIVEGFFGEFRAAEPYKRKGHHLQLVDASARDRLRGALRQLLVADDNVVLDDKRIQNEIGRLTDQSFQKRLLTALKKRKVSLSDQDRAKAEELRKFMLKLHRMLITDRVSAAVHWRELRDG